QSYFLLNVLQLAGILLIYYIPIQDGWAALQSSNWKELIVMGAVTMVSIAGMSAFKLCRTFADREA
ncbi:MAG: hypothetical protein KDD62_14695, partial [Bdellovibrionales bacterium]|nr:hypothetical protein [Bdellovibrionales bacterium]